VNRREKRFLAPRAIPCLWAQVGPASASILGPWARAFPQVVPPAGIEPATRGLGNRCSSPLSYEGGLCRKAGREPG
jgi:hypothetical protein